MFLRSFTCFIPEPSVRREKRVKKNIIVAFTTIEETNNDRRVKNRGMVEKPTTTRVSVSYTHLTLPTKA